MRFNLFIVHLMKPNVMLVRLTKRLEWEDYEVRVEMRFSKDLEGEDYKIKSDHRLEMRYKMHLRMPNLMLMRLRKDLEGEDYKMIKLDHRLEMRFKMHLRMPNLMLMRLNDDERWRVLSSLIN
ncbi:uncharacterized protein LOC125209506 [Salvia hispanica]|uniref:uncharacterized protein LOC125209506 n=1 Tax=Salvia hispanica TaxID=49212 RepID=UPI0020092131|nr:uncharacterized protein LOC125209506 [Salvia hispanica]